MSASLETSANDQRQSHTLSIRITDTMRHRLERARQLATASTGRAVSMSDIAKQLLESAREDRLEVVDLLDAPTETLVRIRRKGEAGVALSRAEWTVIAYYVRHGVESCSTTTPTTVSCQSLAAVLAAFLAVYDLRTAPSSVQDAYYLGNLPEACRPTAAGRGRPEEQIRADLVRATVLEAHRRVSDHTTVLSPGCLPWFAGRNLFAVLDAEVLTESDRISRALSPYWSPLWLLAARGHYAVAQRPIRMPPARLDGLSLVPIPSITQGSFTLSFARGDGDDVSFLLSLPGPLGPRYPIRGCPAVSEFRAMLMALIPDGSTHAWNGRYFRADIVESVEHDDTVVWFRAHDNGLTFGFSVEEWQCLRSLVCQAWALPDIRFIRDTLVREYGEL